LRGRKNSGRRQRYDGLLELTCRVLPLSHGAPSRRDQREARDRVLPSHPLCRYFVSSGRILARADDPPVHRVLTCEKEASLKPAPPVRKLSPSMIKIYGTPPPVSLAHKRFRVCLCHLLVLLYGLCTSPHTHTLVLMVTFTHLHYAQVVTHTLTKYHRHDFRCITSTSSFKSDVL
jgi:hypothetical protein